MPSAKSTSSSLSHPSKRRITSFSPADTVATSAHSCAPPPLPEQLQSDLLTVGMRIRKSISAGYKTKSSFPSYVPLGVYSNWTNPMANPYGNNSNNDSLASVPSSQEGVSDNGVNRGNELKRALKYPSSYGSELNSITGYDEAEDEKEESFPTSEAGREINAFDELMSHRHIAIPKSQKKRDARRRPYHAAVTRRDAVLMVPSEADDFGEASFLRPESELKME
ncbi:hypothetical protein BDZ91DRAFT_714618 [Kalaharituber pfeilii]|nr:hypothetical protein BDZ91DRAFT_714618 [Kalaharituber pfeilii]